jgi:hypothetical protein
MLRRIVMLAVGLGLGAAAWALSGLLMVHLTDVWSPSFGDGEFGVTLYDSAGRPQLLAYLAYFGFLLAVPKWWQQADPLRGSRVSLWSAGVCALWAWLMNAFWPFPQPWGIFIAVAIALSVQLASPWMRRVRTLKSET